ncbi:hypothetical protein MTO96_011015 [Rhipicephalus appendiculatus]
MLPRCVCVFSRRRHNVSAFSCLIMGKKALLILAEGAEEMEAVITADVLRRAGVDVTIAGLTGASPVKCSRDVVVVPDKSLDEAASQSPYDVIVLPGGLKGAESLAASPAVGKLLKEQEKCGRLVAAICAGNRLLLLPLKSHGIGLGKRVTSHPSKKEDICKGDYKYSEDRVVVDGQLITKKLVPPMLVKV